MLTGFFVTAAALAGVWWMFHTLLHRGLRAPRVLESRTPGDLDLPWTAVRIPTVRRRRLAGWLIPAATPGAPAVVVLHGWGGNAEMMLPVARPLFAAGFSLLLIDARSHGASDTDTFSSLPRFAEDLEQAVEWLRRRPEVDPGRIAVLGHSVGAGAALLVASRRRDVAAVVSLAAFAHPAAMMRRWLATKGLGFWPLGSAILAYVQWIIGHSFDSIAPQNTVAAVACPVLVAHGTEDDTVPLEEARTIHARGAATELLLIPGSHDDYGDIESSAGAVVDFLRRAFGMRG